MDPFHPPLPSVLQLDESHPQQTPRSSSFQDNILSGTALASPMYHRAGNILSASALPEPRTYEPPSCGDNYGCSSLDWSIFDGMDLATPPVITTSRSTHPKPSNSQFCSASDTAELDFTPSSSCESSFSHANLEGAIMSIDVKAADLCHRWLSNFSPCWPEEKDFAALEQLTGEPVTRIKTWFGQRLSQLAPPPPSSSFSSTSSQHVQLVSPPSSSPPTPSRSLPTIEACISRKITPPNNHHHTRAFKPQTRPCTPTTSPERLHTRDSSRPFQCTRACGCFFPRKGEWIKHEQKSRPQRVWLCTVDATIILPFASVDETCGQRRLCNSCGEPDPPSSHLVAKHWEDEGDGKTWCRRQFRRKDHLIVHLRTVHGMEDAELGYYGAVGELKVGEELEGWYRWCGFCQREDCFKGWGERMDHLGRHFKKEERTMGDWRGLSGHCGDGG